MPLDLLNPTYILLLFYNTYLTFYQHIGLNVWYNFSNKYKILRASPPLIPNNRAESNIMKILEQLWHNKLTPIPPRDHSNTRYTELLNITCEAEEKLQSLLTDEGKELFQNYTDALADLYDISECDIFINGFRIGAKLMLEITDESKTSATNN